MARWSSALAIVLGVVVGGLATAGAAPDHDGLRVVYRDDRLAGHVDAVPLRDVLDAVAAASGAEIRGQPLDNRPVSADLDAVPIDDALHRLLGSQNFTLSYGSGGRLKTVVLLGGPESPAPPSGPPDAARVAPPPPRRPSRFRCRARSRAAGRCRFRSSSPRRSEPIVPPSPSSSRWRPSTTTAPAARRRRRWC